MQLVWEQIFCQLYIIFHPSLGCICYYSLYNANRVSHFFNWIDGTAIVSWSAYLDVVAIQDLPQDNCFLRYLVLVVWHNVSDRLFQSFYANISQLQRSWIVYFQSKCLVNFQGISHYLYKSSINFNQFNKRFIKDCKKIQ